jgi:MPBQ/MSBQ methyltransferase
LAILFLELSIFFMKIYKKAGSHSLEEYVAVTKQNSIERQAETDNNDLVNRILEALRKAGRNPDKLSPGDLAEVGELHIRGRQATLDLARSAGLEKGMDVLDIGCGIGVPAFVMAREFGCKVTGIDIKESFCETAKALSRRMNLQGEVQFHSADALDMPFEDGSFHVVWLQHMGMTIRDKDRLFSEISRVLRPSGKLAMYEVCLGPRTDMVFPVPWASGPEQNFLLKPDELREKLTESGFGIHHWQDDSDLCITSGQQYMKKARESGPPLLHQGLVIGPEFGLMAKNYLLNLNEDRIRVIRAVLHKI